MKDSNNKVTVLTNVAETETSYLIMCPGCNSGHLFDKRWTFNGDLLKPTFKPSMLVNAGHPEETRCHSFVTDGKIQFLGDCDHELVNQTVELPAI